ncbi:MAG: glycoside hydrolase family 43 protein [Muribaculaceae bacterium]|nr:glycoside hydrolase family 43 protein [Muribaculaceae bacterium]
MFRKAVLLLSAIIPFVLHAQTELSVDEVASMSASKSYKEVGIHDPSIYFCPDDETYYIMGSHIGFAKTSDMLNLTNLGSQGVYTKGYSQEFKSSPEHTVQVSRNGETFTEILPSFNAGAYCATYAGIKVGDRQPTTEANWISGDQWAPDVIYNPNMGKWCMYLSLNGDYWASTIVMLTSDSPSGPFSYQAPIVFSGFNGQTYSGKSVSYKDTDLEIVLGPLDQLPARYKTSSWGNLWPNCIDPCVFFDDNNELWMVYGSWSGGIFILKLDNNTGLRDYTYTYKTETYNGKAPNGASFTGYTSDPYFGKLIAGGCYVSGEGAYVQKIGNFYYLFVTYGGLAPDGGYEMRIFRSANPDGPYVDGTSASAKYTQYVLNYGANATTNKGMKIIGAMNNWGAMTVGECAEGHNSAITDKDGDSFVVYHTKFNNGTQGFQVRIRQLFVNEKGWLVTSPFRFTGKQTRQADIDSRQLFSPEEIAGTYKLLIHPYKLNHKKMAEATPVTVILSADGKISGDRSGSWSYSEDGKSYVSLHIDNITYYGVALNQNADGYNDMPAVCFSATSNQGVPVWLYKLTPKAAVAEAYHKLMNDFIGSDNSQIKQNAPRVNNVNILFDTKNAETGEAEPETLSADGIYSPTEDGHAISISIQIQAGDYVLELGPFTRMTRSIFYEPEVGVYYPVSQQKNLNAGWWSNFSKDNYVLQQGDSADFHFYNYSDCVENWHNWALYGANAVHGASGYSEFFGIRCDNWDNTTGSNNGCSSNFNWDTFKTDMNGSLVNMHTAYGDDGIFTMNSTITTSSGKEYSYSYCKTLSNRPNKITLFFVSEKSYIDGSGLDSGIEDVMGENQILDNKTYNIWGQEVDDSYKGIVIRNGRKLIQK